MQGTPREHAASAKALQIPEPINALAIMSRSLRQRVTPAIAASPVFTFGTAATIASFGLIEETAESQLAASPCSIQRICRPAI